MPGVVVEVGPKYRQDLAPLEVVRVRFAGVRRHLADAGAVVGEDAVGAPRRQDTVGDGERHRNVRPDPSRRKAHNTRV